MEIQTKELSVIKAQSTKALAIAKELKIRTQSGLDEAKEVLCKIAQAQKIVKLKKDGIVKPLNESLKKIRDLFSPIEDTMKEAEMMVKGKMLDYNEFLKKQEQEKTKKIELDVKSGKINIEQAGEKIEKIEEKRDSIPTMRIAKVFPEQD